MSCAVERIHRHIPATEVDALLRKRFQIINLWRPINVSAFDCPLALCEYTSVNPKEDLVPVTLVHPDWGEETYRLKYNPNYKWKYWKGMEPNEVLVFKVYASYLYFRMIKTAYPGNIN